MHAEIKDGKLIVTIPVESELKPSSTGKTLTVASSRGNKPTTAQVNGKPVTVGLNAYVSR